MRARAPTARSPPPPLEAHGADGPSSPPRAAAVSARRATRARGAPRTCARPLALRGCRPRREAPPRKPAASPRAVARAGQQARARRGALHLILRLARFLHRRPRVHDDRRIRHGAGRVVKDDDLVANVQHRVRARRLRWRRWRRSRKYKPAVRCTSSRAQRRHYYPRKAGAARASHIASRASPPSSSRASLASRAAPPRNPFADGTRDATAPTQKTRRARRAYLEGTTSGVTAVPIRAAPNVPTFSALGHNGHGRYAQNKLIGANTRRKKSPSSHQRSPRTGCRTLRQRLPLAAGHQMPPAAPARQNGRPRARHAEPRRRHTAAHQQFVRTQAQHPVLNALNATAAICVQAHAQHRAHAQ